MGVSLKDRFRGGLLGLAIGDALGGRFEGQSAEFIHKRAANIQQLLNYDLDELWYTDDTQMAIAIAESLVACHEIIDDRLCEAFVANYMPSRGYGRGARAVLDAMEDGRDYRMVAATHFPGGSFGNGAAMRVAPLGLFYRHDLARLWNQSRLSALPTHTHPLGIEGAQLVALAVALASMAEQIEPESFVMQLQARCQTPEFRGKLEMARSLRSPNELHCLGNGIEALHSVPTAIASFLLTPHSFEETVGNVILLGGDTDTMAAMAGGISGAFLGARAIPTIWLNKLEDREKGRSYILSLANQLYAAFQSRNETAISSGDV